MAVLDAPPERMTREQAAEYLNVKPGTLAVWACTGRHDLPFYRVGRVVRYDRRELDSWLAARRGTSTTAISAALA